MSVVFIRVGQADDVHVESVSPPVLGHGLGLLLCVSP